MTDFVAMIEVLMNHGVDFIVVGGVSAVLHGAPVNTFDLDIVHSTDAENVKRLLAALEVLGGFYRSQPERRLKPKASHLSSPGHQLLLTQFGPLDLLGMIGRSRRYEDLLPHTTGMKIGRCAGVRVLNLEDVIAVKEETAGEKDLAVLPILRKVLEETRGKH